MFGRTMTTSMSFVALAIADAPPCDEGPGPPGIGTL
jgi:hypothetical protein